MKSRRGLSCAPAQPISTETRLRERSSARRAELKRTSFAYPFCLNTPLPYANAYLTGALKLFMTSSKSRWTSGGTSMIWLRPNEEGRSVIEVMRRRGRRAVEGGGEMGGCGVEEG